MSFNNNNSQKTKILCKYFISGKCIKGENCPYLHSQIELELEDISERECPMYSIGYCKNGSKCKFIHIKKEFFQNNNIIDNTKNKKEESIKEKNNNDSDTSSTPFDEESITKSYHEDENENNKNNNKETKKENNNNNYILPIWYLEHYYDKPISVIFSELDKKDLPELLNLRNKYGYEYGYTKNDNNINMNLNFNNFGMNFDFHNYYMLNLPNMQYYPFNFYSNNNFYNPYYQSPNETGYIEYLISNNRTLYHLVKYKSYKYAKICQNKDIIKIPYFYYEMYKYIYHNDLPVIIIVYNYEYDILLGFAKLEYPAKGGIFNNAYKYFKVRWLWEREMEYSKIRHLINKSDQNHFLKEGKDWCPIHRDLGNYICRLMIKKLNREEISEYLTERQIFSKEIISSKKKYKEDNDDDFYYNDFEIKYNSQDEELFDKSKLKFNHKRKRENISN